MSSYHQHLVEHAIEDRTRSASPTVASGAYGEVEPATLSRVASEQAASTQAGRRKQLRYRLVRLPMAVSAWFRSSAAVAGPPS